MNVGGVYRKTQPQSVQMEEKKEGGKGNIDMTERRKEKEQEKEKTKEILCLNAKDQYSLLHVKSHANKKETQ